MATFAFELETAGYSNAGQDRAAGATHNIGFDIQSDLVLVCRPPSGKQLKKSVGHLAVKTLSELLQRKLISNASDKSGLLPKLLNHAVISANQKILRGVLEDPSVRKLNTEVALSLFHDRQAIFAQTGRTRIYRFRQQRLELLMQEHFPVDAQPQEDSGYTGQTIVPKKPDRTRRAHGEPAAPPRLRIEECRDGDLLLLCTGELTDTIGDPDIELIINALQLNLALAARHLAQLANDCGGRDNFSLALIRLSDKAQSDSRTGWLGRLFGRS